MSASYRNIWLLQQYIITSCNGILTCPSPSNKNSPHSKLKYPCRKIFQLPFLSSGIFCPPPHSPKNFKLPSTGEKNSEYSVLSKICNPPLSIQH